MTSLLYRIQGFIKRSKWLGEIVGSPFSAGRFWIKARNNPLARQNGLYSGYKFEFRGMDLPIIREIIHEKEYDFLNKDIESIAQPVILDIGAHIGLFALTMFKFNAKASVVSIEAGPETFELLYKNKNFNPDLEWTIKNAAAWEDDSYISFDQSVNSMNQKIKDGGKTRVQGISLDALLQETGLQEIDLMKVDIEGAEEAFLQGQKENLKKVKRLVIELHKDYCDTTKVQELLKGIYKNISQLNDRNSSKPVLYCTQ